MKNETTINTEHQAGINKLLAASGPHKFSTEEVIEAIQVQWIKDFGKLADESERDGYFVSGFVHEALKAACASGALEKGVSVECVCPHCKSADTFDIDDNYTRCNKCGFIFVG
jgi:translation initiation factor 2 beta subunit (eIF-2beta)/eIF-5